MHLVFLVRALSNPAFAAAAEGGAVRTYAGQAGAAGLLLLEIVIFHLSGVHGLTAGRRRLATIFFTVFLLAQYAFFAYVTFSGASVTLLPIAAVASAFLLFPFLALGGRLARRTLLGVGWSALGFLIVLTLAIRSEQGRLFDWREVRQELVFSAGYNWGQGFTYWALGFFRDDFMRLFWWTFALCLAGGSFLVLAFGAPPPPPRRPSTKQMPLYAPRRGAKRRRR